ncbi:MAG TPA: PQQ-dependent sugar dehydrogenase, partial [Polyangiaceae bacterium]
VEPTVIVSGLPTAGVNHDGGALAFGPDGKLYWAIGDLGVGVGINEDLTLLASKVGRVNRDGSVPADNPFNDGAGPNEDRIWARGFRNPFTMTFRPSTGALWLDVVGTSLEQVFVVKKGDHGGWATYEYFQPAGFIEPVISYYTNTNYVFGIAADGAVRRGGTTTFTTTTRHWLHPGERMTIQGVTDPSFNGVAFVSSTPSTMTFTVEQPGPDAASGLGSAATPVFGGCITGGTFYDSTAASAEYRGNFFFGDFNAGNLVRARLSGETIRSVDTWATGLTRAVDMSVGADGDLYAATHGGLGPYRYRFRATNQFLVVSRSNVWMLEDGVAAFDVRLSMAPTAPVEVRVRLGASASTLSITRGASLSFGPNDWSTPKPVTIASTRDSDTADAIVDLSVAALDLPIETVHVRIIDEYAAVEPPEGGAGGEGGAAGKSGEGGEGGLNGNAGNDTGGATSGGTGAGARGGTAARGGAGGTAGTSTGAGGEGGEAGEPSSAAQEEGSSNGGCGCSTSRGHGGGAAILALSLLLLRRRARR